MICNEFVIKTVKPIRLKKYKRFVAAFGPLLCSQSPYISLDSQKGTNEIQGAVSGPKSIFTEVYNKWKIKSVLKYLPNKKFNFTDIDECQLEPSVCHQNTECYNIQGSYKCIPNKVSKSKLQKIQEKGQCPSGFAWNINNNACDGMWQIMFKLDTIYSIGMHYNLR